MPTLDDDTAAFIQTGVSISLAAGAPGLPVSVTRGLGCKFRDGGRQLAVFVARTQSQEVLDNIRGSGRVANVFSRPSNNRTVQLKGVDARVLPFEMADLPCLEAHIATFLEEVVPLGFPEPVVRAILAYTADDLATVVYTPSAAYSQTPGPTAGEQIGGAA